MKTSIKTIASAIALTALMAGPAVAASKGDVTLDVLSAVGADGNVFVSVNDNVVTLTGYVDDFGDKTAAINAAKSNDGIDRVIDLTTVSH